MMATLNVSPSRLGKQADHAGRGERPAGRRAVAAAASDRSPRPAHRRSGVLPFRDHRRRRYRARASPGAAASIAAGPAPRSRPEAPPAVDDGPRRRRYRKAPQAVFDRRDHDDVDHQDEPQPPPDHPERAEQERTPAEAVAQEYEAGGVVEERTVGARRRLEDCVSWHGVVPFPPQDAEKLRLFGQDHAQNQGFRSAIPWLRVDRACRRPNRASRAAGTPGQRRRLSPAERSLGRRHLVLGTGIDRDRSPKRPREPLEAGLRYMVIVGRRKGFPRAA